MVNQFNPGGAGSIEDDEDEPQSWEQVAATVVATNWHVDAMEPTAPQPEPYVPPPAPAPTVYDEGPSAPAQSTQQPARWEPTITEVSNEDYFSDLFDTTVDRAPSPGEGTYWADSLWYGSDEDQEKQLGFWNQEVDLATASGDREKYNALMQQYDEIARGWQQYSSDAADYLANANAFDSMLGEAFSGAPMAGEGGYTRLPGQMRDDGGPAVHRVGGAHLACRHGWLPGRIRVRSGTGRSLPCLAKPAAVRSGIGRY